MKTPILLQMKEECIKTSRKKWMFLKISPMKSPNGLLGNWYLFEILQTSSIVKTSKNVVQSECFQKSL